MTPEKAFENLIVAEFARQGWFARHFDAPGLDGWPDILALRGRAARLVEVKAGTKIRTEQSAFHAHLERHHDVPVWIIEKKKDAYVLSAKWFALPVVLHSLADAVGMVIL